MTHFSEVSKKIETIWHHILYEAATSGAFQHTQKGLAERFGYSVSTVHHALKAPAAMGMIRKEGKFFVLQDPGRLLQYMATVRALDRDVLYRTRMEEPVRRIEALALPGSIFGCFGAAARRLREPPADYDVVHFYIAKEELPAFERRFPKSETAHPNVIALNMHPAMARYGPVTTIIQTYADCWNLREWYARDFTSALLARINDLLPAWKTFLQFLHERSELPELGLSKHAYAKIRRRVEGAAL